MSNDILIFVNKLENFVDNIICVSDRTLTHFFQSKYQDKSLDQSSV